MEKRRSKGIMKVVLGTLVVLAVLLVISRKQGHSAKAAEHSHTYQWIVKEDSTCYKTGTTQYKCTICGQVKMSQTNSKKSHNYKVTTTKAATCTSKGSELHKCTNSGCTYSFTKEIPMKDHSYKWVEAVSATCYRTGRTDYKCSSCGQVKQSQTISKKSHNYKLTSSVAATCTKKGSETYKCANSGCSESYTKEIPMKDHAYSWVVKVDSTCSAEGITECKCSSCGQVKMTEKISKKEHTIVTTRTEPTTTKEGKEVKSCKVCGTVLSTTILPKLTPAVCTVTYNPCNGTTPWTDTKNQGDTYGTLPTVKRSGYDFKGWYTSASGGTKITPTTKVPASKTVTLYGVWEGVPYSVKYDANGGEGTPGEQTKIHGTPLTLRTGVPHKDANTFLGWATTSDATTATYQPGGSYTANAAVTLYAVWQPYVGFVYNANGGSGTSPIIVRVPVGETVKVVEKYNVRYTRTGYKFVGWSTSKTATKATYTGGEQVVMTGKKDVTLYAVWEKEKYTISFNANNGVGGPTQQTKLYGETLTLTTARPTRTGGNYVFLGWSTSKTAKTATYKPGGLFTIDAPTTLYAVWGEGVKLSFDRNGGSGNAPAAIVVMPGEKVTVPSCSIHRDGYWFMGWATTRGGKVVYKSGNQFVLEKDTVLYAVWDQIFCKFKYDLNGGTGTPPIGIGTEYGKENEVAARWEGAFHRDGYTFLGWSTSKTAKTATYTGRERVVLTSDVQLYAVWKANTYTISFNPNNGVGGPTKQTKTHDVTLTLTKEYPTRTGKNYVFLGWSTSKSATTATYKPGGAFKINADTTLYAVWGEGVKLSFDRNGGSGNAPAAIVVMPGEKVTVPSCSIHRDGYWFMGWATTRGGKVVYKSGNQFVLEKDTVLYAVWDQIFCKFKYDLNGGTGTPPIEFGTEYGKPNQVANRWEGSYHRDGYTFLGWSTSKTATTPEYTGGEQVVLTSDVQLYAVWKAKTYTISFNPNDGVGGPTKQTKTHGVTLTLTKEYPTRNGYIFLGWSTSKNATTPTYKQGSSFTTNADTVLYAVWAKSAKLSFDRNGGSGNAPAASYVVLGSTVKIPSCSVKRDGYYFMGWATYRGGDAKYKSGDEITVKEDTVLYASWKQIMYKINYDLNGGTGKVNNSFSVGYGGILQVLDPWEYSIERAGYEFRGWSFSKDAYDATYHGGETIQMVQNLTLYAIWWKKK